MKLGGGECLVAKIDGGELPAPDAAVAVVAILPGGSFVVAFGPDAVSAAAPGGVRAEAFALVSAARSLGSRAILYTEDLAVELSADIEVLSLRSSVEPFVREALRSHAEGCTLAWTEDDERRMVPAMARLGDGRELPAGEAIEQAMAASARAVVLGDFGSGKSAQLLRRASKMAAAYLEDRAQNPCPLMLSLRGMPPDLGEILREHVPGMSLPAFWLAAELGMVVSIFDSLDELDVQAGDAESPIHALTAFAEGGRARVVVAASRLAFLVDRAAEAWVQGAPPSAVVSLSGLRAEDAAELVRRGLGSLGSDEEEAAKRVRAIEAEHDLRALAGRPALLELIAFRRRWLAAAGSAVSEPVIAAGPGLGKGVGALAGSGSAGDGGGDAGFLEAAPVSLRGTPREVGMAGSVASQIAASIALTALRSAPLYAAATRDWLWSARADADKAALDQGLLAARALARILFERSFGSAAIEGAEAPRAGEIAAAFADEAEGRRAVELLRPAAFIARMEGAGEDARIGFIHRSFLDYFLAADIAAGIDEGREGALDLPRLPPAVLGFLVGMRGWDQRKKRLREILQRSYRARVSENALAAIYAAARTRADGEALSRRLMEDLPSGMKLAGAKLGEMTLAWASLPEADLSGADLSLTDLMCADLRGARLDRARADHANFDGADLEWSTLAGTDLFGASFVSANLTGVSLLEASSEGVVRIGARGDGGALISPGLDVPPDMPMRWFVESAPHMGQALSLSPDGRWIAVARGFTVAILDAATGNLRMILPGATSCALAVAFSPDGRLLVSAAKDGSIRVWDARKGSLLRVIDIEPSWVIALAFSPDSEILASVSDGGPLRIWDVRRGDLVRVLEGRAAWYYSVAFSAGGDLLGAAGADGSIRVWDARKGSLLSTISAPTGPYMCMAFSPDGSAVASTSDDDSIRIWDARRGHLMATLTRQKAEPSPSRPAAARDRNLSALESPAGGTPIPFMAVAYSPDGAFVAASSSESGLCVWDTRRGALLCTVEGGMGACSIVFAPSSAAILFTLTDGSIHAADPRTGRLLRSFRGHASTVDTAVISPAGDTIASASAGGDIRMWDARRGDLLRTLKQPGHVITALAFSIDGDALASGDAGGSAALWDARDGSLVRTLAGGSARIASLSFSPNGDLLAAADAAGEIHLWDPTSGEHVGALLGHTAAVHSVAFLPDGDTLASASADGSIRLWDARLRSVIRVVEGRTVAVHSVAFSPDGDKLASAYADGSVRLWDAEGGDLIEVLEGHTASVSSVAFSLDGDMLITSSADGTVRLWRVADGRCLCLLLAAEDGWVTLVGDAPFFIGGGDVSTLLRFTAGSASMPAALWAPVFRRPDLVAKALWGDTPSAATLGLSTVAACEAALLEARVRLGLGRSRRAGPTAAIAVYKHAGPLSSISLAEEAARTPTERKFPMKRALTWIHLSDLHFGADKREGPHRFDQQAVMRAICRDVAEINLKPPDFIFVTGDIAWSAQPSEYDEAKSWLEKLVSASGASIDKLRLIPGNHDVDRGRANTKPVARAHSEIRAAPEEIDNELSDAALRDALAHKLGAYADFVKAVAPRHPAAGPNGLDWSERVPPAPGQRGRVRLAGLSTVWISDGSDGRLHKGQAVPFIRNMILGERQMQQVFGDLEEDELLVVLTHHPPEWLHRDSAEEFAKAVSRRTHIHMCGHIHDAPQASIQKRFGVFGTSVRYVAGAAHGDLEESKKHGYAWGAVRWNGDAAQWQAGWAPRVYDAERDQMRPDSERYKLDQDGFIWEPMRIHWRSPVTVEVQG
jgi:WD40 repeat protein/predicted MPP superfamily phosphohydrolase